MLKLLDGAPGLISKSEDMKWTMMAREPTKSREPTKAKGINFLTMKKYLSIKETTSGVSSVQIMDVYKNNGR